VNDAIRQTLSGFSNRPRGVVREHEILRVSGLMLGPNPESCADQGRREILQWAQMRCGGRLPPEAWRCESFEYLSGGRNRSCIRLQTEESDIWAIRADDPDTSVPGRVWTTEIVIGLHPGERARFSARLLASTAEDYLQIEPSVPRCVLQIIQVCGLTCGGQRVRTEATLVETAEEVETLIGALVDPARHLPSILITLPNATFERHPFMDAERLARGVAGLAQVYVLHPACTWALSERFGRVRGVFGGAVRLYFAGFSDACDPYAHRLILADRVASPEGAAHCEAFLRQSVAEESVRRAALGRDVLAFSAIRTASLSIRQAELETASASDTEQLRAARARLAALETQVLEQKAEQEYYLAEYESERLRAETAERQLQESNARNQQLLLQLRAKGGRPNAEMDVPAHWSELADWCEENLRDRLVLTPAARKGMKAPLFDDVAVVARCLRWLAESCLQRRIEGGAGSLRDEVIEEGVRNSPCGSDKYFFDWQGRRLTADWHVKNGGNTRDPARCLRIYYCFDDETQRIIVSDLPAHRRTGAS